MIICPLNQGECNRPIPPKVKTVFVMAPSAQYQTAGVRIVLREVIGALSDLSYNIVEGSKIRRHGDYFCAICQNTQGCAMGVSFVYDGLPVGTIGNIYLETGLMQGFGKPVILLVDKRKTLPSDYARHYAIFFNSKDYLSKYKSLLEDIAKLPEEMYEHLGQVALSAEDYEKAAKYYQEAYLISPKQDTLVALKSIVSTLEKAKDIPREYKQRLLDSILYFCSKVS